MEDQVQQAADIQKLIMFGKKERDVTITVVDPDTKAEMPFRFHLETPTAEQLVGPLNNADSIGIVVAHVARINEQEFSVPSQKEDLRKLISKMQNSIVRVLVDVCGEMAVQQNELTEKFTKK